MIELDGTKFDVAVVELMGAINHMISDNDGKSLVLAMYKPSMEMAILQELKMQFNEDVRVVNRNWSMNPVLSSKDFSRD